MRENAIIRNRVSVGEPGMPDRMSPCPDRIPRNRIKYPQREDPGMTDQGSVTKRIPVSSSTWQSVHQLKKPGQTYDDVIRDLVRKSSEDLLVKETNKICKRGKFVEYKL